LPSGQKCPIAAAELALTLPSREIDPKTARKIRKALGLD
jgi:hypothetical protein